MLGARIEMVGALKKKRRRRGIDVYNVSISVYIPGVGKLKQVISKIIIGISGS